MKKMSKYYDDSGDVGMNEQVPIQYILYKNAYKISVVADALRQTFWKLYPYGG